MPFGDSTGGTIVTSNTGPTTGDGRVWQLWTTSTASSNIITNASTATNTTIWSAWNQAANITVSSSGTAATNTVTVSGSTDITITNRVWQAWQKPAPEVMRRLPQRDREYYERLERERDEYRRRAEAAEAARKLAEEKAEKLLLSVLSPEQRDEYLKHGRFHVRTADGRLYRINKGRHGNMELLERDADGELIIAENLCVHVQPNCPNQDNMVAQKLMIESGMEDELRRIANISDYRRRRRRAA